MEIIAWSMIVACLGVLSGIPAALLVLATGPGRRDDDEDDEFAAYCRTHMTAGKAAMLLRMEQEQLFAYMTGTGGA